MENSQRSKKFYPHLELPAVQKNKNLNVKTAVVTKESSTGAEGYLHSSRTEKSTNPLNSPKLEHNLRKGRDRKMVLHASQTSTMLVSPNPTHTDTIQSLAQNVEQLASTDATKLINSGSTLVPIQSQPHKVQIIKSHRIASKLRHQQLQTPQTTEAPKISATVSQMMMMEQSSSQPHMVMYEQIDESGEHNLISIQQSFQSKKNNRNNLKSHNLSSVDQVLGRQQQKSIVGQPYINFKNSILKQENGVNSHKHKGSTIVSQNPPLNQHQQQRSSRNQQSKRRMKNTISKSSFSSQLSNGRSSGFNQDESKMEIEAADMVRYPQIIVQQTHESIDDIGMMNRVINVLGGHQQQSLHSSALQTSQNRSNPTTSINMRQRKNQKSQMSLGILNNNVQSSQPQQHSKRSPYAMKIAQNVHKTTNNNNRQVFSMNSSAMAYDDLPITISDQAASSTFNEKHKHQIKMLPSIASALADEGSYNHQRSQLRKNKNKEQFSSSMVRISHRISRNRPQNSSLDYENQPERPSDRYNGNNLNSSQQAKDKASGHKLSKNQQQQQQQSRGGVFSQVQFVTTVDDGQNSLDYKENNDVSAYQTGSIISRQKMANNMIAHQVNIDDQQQQSKKMSMGTRATDKYDGKRTTLSQVSIDDQQQSSRENKSSSRTKVKTEASYAPYSKKLSQLSNRGKQKAALDRQFPSQQHQHHQNLKQIAVKEDVNKFQPILNNRYLNKEVPGNSKVAIATANIQKHSLASERDQAMISARRNFSQLSQEDSKGNIIEQSSNFGTGRAVQNFQMNINSSSTHDGGFKRNSELAHTTNQIVESSTLGMMSLRGAADADAENAQYNYSSAIIQRESQYGDGANTWARNVSTLKSSEALDMIEVGSTFNNSVARRQETSEMQLTPSQKQLEDASPSVTTKKESTGQKQTTARKVRQRPFVANVDLLPYMRPTKLQRNNNLQTLDRKRQTSNDNKQSLAGGTLSQSPAMQSQHQLREGARSIRVKREDGLISQASKMLLNGKFATSKRLKLEESHLRQGRVSKNNLVERNSINSTNQNSEHKNSLSPRVRALHERTDNPKGVSYRAQKFATQGAKKENTTVGSGFSSSVTSLPRILNQDNGIAYNTAAQNTRLDSQHSSQKNQPQPAMNVGYKSHKPQKTSVAGIAVQASKQLSQRQTEKQKKEYPALTPVGDGDFIIAPPVIGGKGKNLQKPNGSNSVLKQQKITESVEVDKNHINIPKQQLPSVKKKVSIHCEQDNRLSISNLDLFSEKQLNSNNQVISIQDSNYNSPNFGLAQTKSKRRRGTPIMNKKPSPNSKGTASSTILQHKKSNSLSKVNHMRSSLHDSSHDWKNAGLEFDGETDDDQHEIRIEISKTEVLDSMKKDHSRDLSLLYYDFNNSKARLMSKMKGKSDFIIQEDAEISDGDKDAQSPIRDQKVKGRNSKVKQYESSPSPLSLKPKTIVTKKLAISDLMGERISQNIVVQTMDSPIILRSKNGDQSLMNFHQLKTTNKVVEASSAIKQLDLPENIRSSGLLSSHDVLGTAQQTEMELVNRKIDKAKQSISQLQTEGGIAGMSLQSPARLANSRNSSTNTLKQNKHNIIVMSASGSNENNISGNKVQSQYTSELNSPRKLKGSKLFMFNQQKSLVETDTRNKSPCFGSVKNSTNINNNEVYQRFNSEEVFPNLDGSGSKSMSSLILQQKQAISPQPQQNDISKNSNQESSIDQPIGCTGATELNETNYNQMVPIEKHGMGGTGFESIAKKQNHHRDSQVSLNKKRLLKNHQSPLCPTEYKRKSQDSNSDLAAVSSHRDNLSSAQNLNVDTLNHLQQEQREQVTSVVQFVKENSKIWE